MELSKKDIDFLVSILKKYIDTSLATITNRSRIKVHHFEEQYMRTVNGGLPLDQSLFRTYLQTCGKVNVWIDLDKTGVFPEEKDSDVLYFIWQDDGYNMYIYTDKYVLVTSGSDKSYIDDENKSLDTTYSSDKVEELISALAQESDPVFNQWLLDNSAYLNALLVEQPPLPTTKYLNGERQWVALPSVGDIEHDDTLNKNGNPNFLHITQEQKNKLINNYTYKILNTSISNWVASTTYSGYLFQATINISNLIEGDFVDVLFNSSEVISGNYLPVHQQHNGYIIIYSKVNTTITIPTIVVTKILL